MGASVPFTDIREGNFFKFGDGWYFLSFEDAGRTVTLELGGRAINGRRYLAVVLGVDDLEQVRAAISALAHPVGGEQKPCAPVC